MADVLSARLGGEPGRWELAPIEAKLRGEIFRGVYRASRRPAASGEAGEELALKICQTPERARSEHARLEAACAPGAPDLAPRPLFLDEDAAAIGMALLDGPTLDQALVDETIDRDEGLRAAGAWLAELHSRAPKGRRPLRPAKRVQALAEPNVHIWRPRAFRARLPGLQRAAAEARGTELTMVAAHGDFHPRNLVLTPDGLRGFDFGPDARLPALSELARFLVLTALRCPRTGAEPGVDPSDVAALLDGYGAPEAAGGAPLRFFIALQALRFWRLRAPLLERTREDNAIRRRLLAMTRPLDV